MAKQKNNSNGKRGDKRNGKVPKSKSDSFSLKAGLVSFSSAAGGNNILGTMLLHKLVFLCYDIWFQLIFYEIIRTLLFYYGISGFNYVVSR